MACCNQQLQLGHKKKQEKYIQTSEIIVLDDPCSCVFLKRMYVQAGSEDRGEGNT